MIIEMSGGVHIQKSVNMLLRGLTIPILQILYIVYAEIHFALNVAKSSTDLPIAKCSKNGN